MLWPSAEQVVALHDRLVAETGGATGLRDAGLLDSVLHRPLATYRGVELYPDLAAKVAALVEAPILDDPFVDGDERTAMATGIAVLRLNGVVLPATPEEIGNTGLWVAEHHLSLADLTRWLQARASGPP